MTPAEKRQAEHKAYPKAAGQTDDVTCVIFESEQ
jgi:hypothetical protein